MNIAFDLDTTLVDLQTEEMNIAKKYNCNEYPMDWNFSNYSDECKKEIYEMFRNPDIMCNLKPLPGVKNTLDELKSHNNLFIITARHNLIKKQTEEYVYKLFNIHPIVVDFGESKLPILKDLNIDVWFDDCPHQVLEIQDEGIISVLISNKTTPYNYYIRDKVYYIIESLDGLTQKDIQFIIKGVK
jgi:5'(3')-deoxyribonucleotidase